MLSLNRRQDPQHCHSAAEEVRHGLNLRVGHDCCIPGYARARQDKANGSKKKGKGGGIAAWTNPKKSSVVLQGLKTEDSDKEASQKHGWEFSTRALNIVKAYKRKFPDVFKALEASPEAHMHECAAMFGPGEAGQKKLDKVCKWLRQLDTFHLKLVPDSSKILSRDAIASIEQAATSLRKNLDARIKSAKKKSFCGYSTSRAAVQVLQRLTRMGEESHESLGA